MKKINSFAALCSLTAIFAIAPSCQKEIALENVDDQVPAGYEKVTLTAGLDTKINGDINGGIKWNSSSENISVFYTIGNEFKLAKFYRINCSGTADSGTFSGTVETGDKLFKYVVFPYNASQTISGDGKIKANMSKGQGPTNADGLTSGSILAGKITGTEVSLATTCAYLRVNLPVTRVRVDKNGAKRNATDIKTVKITGHRTSDSSDETKSFMSGTCYITFDADGKPSLSPRIATNYDSIELHPKSVGDTIFCGGEILCPIFPGTYDKLAFELQDYDNKSVGSFEVNATNVFKRGLAKNLGTIYFPHIKTGTIGNDTYGTRTISADSDGSTLTLTGSADAFVGHPAKITDYEFGFEAWAGDSQLDDIVATTAAPTEGKKGESVDFSFTSNDAAYASVTKVKAYAKVLSGGDKVYGEEMNVTKPKEVRTVTFNFTDGKFTTDKFDDSYSFVYDTPAVGDYKCVDDKGTYGPPGSDQFPTVSYQGKPFRAAQIKMWNGSEWVTDPSVTTSSELTMLGGSLTKIENGISYTIKIPKGLYTRSTATVTIEEVKYQDTVGMFGNGTDMCLELPAFAGFKLTKVICSNPTKTGFYAGVLNDTDTELTSKTRAEVKHSAGDWYSIFEVDVPIAPAEAGAVQYLRINSMSRMPYFILEYTEQ